MCPTCKISKPVEDFPTVRTWDGACVISPHCTQCRSSAVPPTALLRATRVCALCKYRVDKAYLFKADPNKGGLRSCSACTLCQLNPPPIDTAPEVIKCTGKSCGRTQPRDKFVVNGKVVRLCTTCRDIGARQRAMKKAAKSPAILETVRSLIIKFPTVNYLRL